MIDRFTECLVKKVPDSMDKLKKIIIITLLIIITAAVVYLSVVSGFYLLLTIVLIGIYGAYFLLKNMSIEYEYIFTNGELDIDKISGQQKRENLVTLNVNKFEDFGKISADTPEKPNATLFLCSDNTGINEYYADVTTEEYGETRLIFTPSEKMVSYIEEALPPMLKYRKRNI